MSVSGVSSLARIQKIPYLSKEAEKLVTAMQKVGRLIGSVGRIVSRIG